MRPITPILAFALCFPAVATAQEPPEATLPPVVVESSRAPDERTRTETEAREELRRVPGGTGVVGQQTIEDSRAANLKDALDFVPGVFVQPRFGAADESQISIRGSGLRNNFHLRGVSVLIDGFPYGNADGFSDFESLELLTTKRIEVYKGANALRFGGYTLGGAINLVTKTGYDAPLVELRSAAGSFGYLKNYVGTGQVYGPLDLYVGLSDTELNGYRQHGDQIRRRAYASLGYRLPGGTTVRLDLGYVQNEENLPGALTQQELGRNPRQRNPSASAFSEERSYDYTRGALTVRTPLGDNQVLTWFTQVNYQDMDHPLSFAIIDDTTYSYGTELRYVLTAPVLGLASRLTAGFQFFGTRQIDVNFVNNLGNRGARTKNQLNIANNIAGYVEEQLDLTSTFTAVAGGRVNYAIREVRDRFLSNGNQSDSVDFFSASPKAGVVWKAAPTVQVFGNVSHAHEPPLLLELTAPGQLGGNLGQLAAQKSWQFEVGTRGNAGERLAWDASVYDIELWDEIQNVNVQPFPGAPFTIPRYRNIDRSRHTGVEAGVDLLLVKDILSRIGLGPTGDTLRARAAYTWSRFVFVDDANFGSNDLPGAPRHFIQTELHYDHGSGFWIAPGLDIVPKGYFVSSENDARNDPYTLVNVKAGFEHKPTGLGVFFEARNLTDTTYAAAVAVDDANRRFFFPGDGRSFYGGLSWRWR
ncbi:MAG: TonB-dependent receptor family protein [Candidatus Rokuibacteriota bacterium]